MYKRQGEEGENGSMTVTDGVERKITLKEGDLIGIINTESEDSALMPVSYTHLDVYKRQLWKK